MDPLVTVVLPTRDRAPVLGRAMASVLHQTHADLELVVVDDASEDATSGIVERCADPRVRYIRLDRRRGAPGARNVGIAIAAGRFIAFQDSDDVWLPDKLAEQVGLRLRAGPRTAVVYTSLLRYTDHGVQTVPDPSDPRARSGDLRRTLIHGNLISTQTAMVDAAAIRDIGGFDERLPRLQEWDLWLSLADRHEFAFVDRPLVHAYVSHDSISRDADAYAVALELILAKHAARFDADRTARARMERALAKTAAGRRDLRSAAIHVGRAVRSSPASTLTRYARDAVGALRRRAARHRTDAT